MKKTSIPNPVKSVVYSKYYSSRVAKDTFETKKDCLVGKGVDGCQMWGSDISILWNVIGDVAFKLRIHASIFL